MDFVDWCGQVLRALIEASGQSAHARGYGVHDRELGRTLFGDLVDQPTYWESRQREGMLDALMELKKIGLVAERNSRWQVTPDGRQYIDDMTNLWELICQIKSQPDQAELLHAVNQLSQQCADDHARVEQVRGPAIVAELGWPNDLGGVVTLHAVVRELEERHLVHDSSAIGEMEATWLHATCQGLIWETRRVFTVESKYIDQLVASCAPSSAS